MSESVEASAERVRATSVLESTHPSAMRTTFSWVVEFLARRVFSGVVMQEWAVDKIRELSHRGTVIYVLRHRSFVDYLLVNYVLRREGLDLPVFANGISSTLIAPIGVMFRALRERLLGTHRNDGEATSYDHDYCAKAVAAGRPVLIFMRGRREGTGVAGWLRRAPSARVGSEYLREIVHGDAASETEKFIVPLALFRGHSFRRREPGISALVYSVQEMPSDARKLAAYWWNRSDLFIAAGKEVDVREFVQRYSADSEERVVRRLVRAIQIFLHREERVVLGPALLPRRRIKAFVLENESAASSLRKIAADTQVPIGKLRRQAERYFDEMAADFNGILFGIIAFVFKKIWGRMFSGVVPIGLPKVIEKVRHHPVVLVPCHRSHFDYLILTYLFHLNFVSPPHIAAGNNLSFWPLGPLFRSAGAFFIRRSFAEDELYKLVFREYLTFLIREGYTQEFFIEGGRSRTGKMMTPRLGMLAAIVNSYLSGIRRDLFFVPVSIHYGRIVEEAAYQRELEGEAKQKENLRGLLQARRFLKQKFGMVYVSFADPISLNEALGDRKQRFTEGMEVPEIEEEKRRFVQRLGFRLLREVNDASVAGATSISATVLLGAPHSGRRYSEFVAQANALADLVVAQRLPLTASLERNRGDFRENLRFLSNSGHITILRRGGDEVIVIAKNRRLALDFYKNNLIHTFLLPSLITFCLLHGVREEDLTDRIRWWLDLFRYEFPLPTRAQVEALVGEFLTYARGVGAMGPGGIVEDHPLVQATSVVLDNFRESYWVAARNLRDELPAEGVPEKALLATISEAFETSLLLGEVTKSEGRSAVVFGNALRRYKEMGFIRFEQRGKGKRDKTVVRGDRFAELGGLIDELGSVVRTAQT